MFKAKGKVSVAAFSAVALALSVGTAPANAAATGKIEVFSWWTSGSEDAALQAIISASKTANPGLEVINAAVAGGAGTNAKQVLATRLGGGDAPEIWQTHPGGELGNYVDQGVLTDMTALYKSEGWDKVVPKDLVASMTYNKKTYSVLTGVHRANTMWISSAAQKKAGVKLSGSLTWPTFKAAALKMKAKGIDPICLGDKDIWTAAQLLEALIVAEEGATGWTALLNGTKKWTSAGVKKAVANFNEAMTWTNKDHKALDWTGAVAALAKGTCGVNIMGDWAYGELLVKQEKVDGVDFTYATFGDANTFVTVGDSFVIGKTAKNQAGAVAFAKAIMDPKVQLAFNKLKGSAPVRSDVSTKTLGKYQQGAAKVLANGKKVPSLVHGQALVAAAVGQAYADAVTLLQANKDVAKFSKAMDAAIAAN
jgi:glucose/mannose transport system substrate-binding protein